MNPFLRGALEWLAEGCAVFPLVPGAKTPLTPNGFKDATHDMEQVYAWWERWPEANIGIATGETSNLVVLDVDKKNDGLSSLIKLEDAHGPLLTTTVGTGGGGRHYYFRHPGKPVKNKAGVLPGIDIRGDGGYVVAPPSVTTGVYELQIQMEPVACPDWLSQLASPPAPRVAELLIEGMQELAGGKGELNKRTLAFVAHGAPSGLWHQEFFQAAMNCKQNNYSYEEAEQLLSKATGHLDSEHDIPQLLDVYENRQPEYPPTPKTFADLFPTAVDFRIPEKWFKDGFPPETPSLVVKASELSKEMLSFLSDKAQVKGTPTGLVGLDALLGGGKRTGEVTAWHAEAKTGKNTLWHKLMFLWLNPQVSSGVSPVAAVPMGYASRELTPESEVLPNILSLQFQENAWLAEMDEERKRRYEEAISSWPLYFARGYGYFSLDEIKRWVASLRSAGVKFFWFDHLHYMLEDPEDHKAASKLIKEIKTLAKQEDIHVDIIIQPNKLAEGQRLSLNSIKGGSAMGQAIDNLLVLERVKGHRNISKLTLDVGRSKLCKPGKLYLEYNPATTEFIEVEPVEEESWNRPYTLANPG